MRKRIFSMLVTMLAVCFCSLITALLGANAVIAGAATEKVYTPTRISLAAASNQTGIYLELIGGNHGMGDYWTGIDMKAIHTDMTFNGEDVSVKVGDKYKYDIRCVGASSQYIWIGSPNMDGQGNLTEFTVGTVIVVKKGKNFSNPQNSDGNFIITDNYTLTYNGNNEWDVVAQSENVDWNTAELMLAEDVTSDNSQLYLQLSDGGHGFEESIEPIPELYYYITGNNDKFINEGGTFTSGGADNLLRLTKSGGFVAGDVLIIKKDMKYYDESDITSNFSLNKDYIARFDGSAWTINEYVYEMPEGILSDFTENSVQRLEGAAFTEAINNSPMWGVDFASDFIGGRYLAAEEAEGIIGETTEGAYEMSWPEVNNRLFPTIMFKFNTGIKFDVSDDLVFRIYLDENMDKSFEMWIVRADTYQAWDAQTKKSGSSMSYGWNDVNVSAKDYVDNDGNIVPIAFVFNYQFSHAVDSTLKAGKLYFDTARFEEVQRYLADDYDSEDISAIIPVGNGKTFTGEYEGTEDDADFEFDFSKELNIAFVRTDKSVHEVNMRLTINDMSDFNFYFVLNGNDIYYNKGGIFYWFSDEGISLGYYGKTFETVAYPSGTEAGKPFDLTLSAIPYYVDGISSGYMAKISMNGEVVYTDAYVSSADCAFGRYFGMYLHNSDSSVEVTVESINQSQENPVEVTISTMMNANKVNVGESLKLNGKLTGKFYGADQVKFEIVEGEEFAYIDQDNFLVGKSNGTVKVRGYVENVFGKFTSDTITVAVGDGSSSGKTGCGGNISSQSGSAILMLLCAGIVLVTVKAKKSGQKSN